jgi:hypothetical protein
LPAKKLAVAGSRVTFCVVQPDSARLAAVMIAISNPDLVLI